MPEDSQFRAMVLAAGVGSRMEPISSVVPKPLVKIGGRPVMEHILLLLKKHGATEVISNTHHLAEQIQGYFADAEERLGVKLQFVHEDKLSGVAGGIRRCQDFLRKKTACIIMGDALTDIDLGDLYAKHKKAVAEHNCLVTVAQMQVEDTSQFGVIVTDSIAMGKANADGRIISFQEKPKPEEAKSNWANTGVYFFEAEVYDYIPNLDEAPVYDVAKDLFPRLLAEDKYMQAIAVKSDTYWADIGNPNQYLKSLEDIAAGKVKLDLLAPISEDAKLADSVKLKGCNEIGPNCEIGDDVSLTNCLLWDGVKIKAGAKLKNCILASNVEIGENATFTGKVMVAASSFAQKTTV